MKPRVGILIELAAMIGLGLALRSLTERWFPAVNPYSRETLPNPFWSIWVISPFLCGVAIVGAVVNVIELAKRGPASEWGLGRWTLSACGVGVVLWVACCAVISVGSIVKNTGAWPEISYLPLSLGSGLSSVWSNTATWWLVALAASWLVAPRVSITSADGREWIGRVFLIVTVLTAIASELGRQFWM